MQNKHKTPAQPSVMPQLAMSSSTSGRVPGLRHMRLDCRCKAPQTTAQIRIGTRSSKLALLQVQQVKNMLQRVKPDWSDDHFKFVPFQTHGDQDKEQQLRILGQGAFTEVIDQAVADGKVDIGVHSLKDQPVQLPKGVKLAACLPRADPRDALISRKANSIADLPRGARVGTSSLRRKAQLLHAHPHLRVMPVRGNVDQRIEMLETGELDAIVLAAAGLSRLGQQHLITCVLGLDEMLPAACQGAIGITCNSSDSFLSWELGLICHEPTMLEVAAERAVLSQLLIPAPAAQQTGGSKSSSRSGPAVPTLAPTLSGISSVTGLPLLPNFAIACHAGFDSHEGSLRVDGLVASEDGRTLHRLQVLGGAAAPEDAEKLGKQLGQQLRAVAAQHGWLDK